MTNPPPAASILVACRNEELNVEKCIREIARVLPQAEIVIIDGGIDRTFEIAQSLCGEFPLLRVVKNEGDVGKGHAIRTGINIASASIMAQFDCDLQFGADDLPALLAPIGRGECDLTFGSRFIQHADRTAYRPVFFRDVGNRLLAGYVSLLIGRRVTDVTAGIKAWTREAINQVDFHDDRYSYEVEVVIRAAVLKLRFVEVPVRYSSRMRGESMHRDTWAVIKAGLVIVTKAFAARIRRDRV